MCHRNFGIVVFSLVVLVCVGANPIIIRSGVVKTQGQKQDANSYDATHHKGIANFEGDEGFNKGNEKKYLSSVDSGRYGEESDKRKDHLDQNSYDKGSFYQNGGGDVSDFADKKAHKKGHHKSGFQNSYHKDEQGSNSSYFDDGNDEGDEYVYKTHKGSYGDAEKDNRRGGNTDASHYSNEGGKRGQYDNAGKFEKDLGNRQTYNRNKYNNDREDANRRNLANAYGSGGRYNEEKYVERRPYYNNPYEDPYYNSYNRYNEGYPKKHITIYEDPRYDGRLSYKNSNRYGDDYVELDVRPPYRDAYHDRRPSYDYY
ncbi:unnamed protein product [Phaedon cochleariae]|uniref:Uncharacterized protein n=1 Tax=Phaedon cochleariae TaxID=80249 RepID=A0A9P0DSV3_PHACE|nr:unnamed protein product [Phaedon cochleariae]